MSNGWPILTVDEIARSTSMGPFGSRIRKENYRPSGIPVIRGFNLDAERFLDDGFAYLSEEKANELKRSNAFPQDIVFVAQGSIGYVGIIPKESKYERYVLSQNLMRVSCDTHKADPLFVFYYFRSPYGQHEILSYVNPTGVPCISRPLTSLRSFRVPSPPLAEQKAIAQILGTLDDKIELNRRMNQTLEAIARAIFKSWFVDFDPVWARLNGEQPVGMDAETVALFPDGFTDSSLGQIPQGWRVGTFDELIEIIGGGTPKTSVPGYWSGDIPWFSVKDLPAESDVYVIDTEKKVTQAGVDNSSTKVLPEGTTIITARGTVGKLALVGIPMAMNQTCYGIRGTDGYLDLFTFFHLRSIVSELQQRTHGTVFDTITRSTFATIETIIPPVEVAQAFDVRVRPMVRLIRTNLFQSRTLAELRDTLLPKLISGQLRISDAEKLRGVAI